MCGSRWQGARQSVRELLVLLSIPHEDHQLQRQTVARLGTVTASGVGTTMKRDGGSLRKPQREMHSCAMLLP